MLGREDCIPEQEGCSPEQEGECSSKREGCILEREEEYILEWEDCIPGQGQEHIPVQGDCIPEQGQGGYIPEQGEGCIQEQAERDDQGWFPDCSPEREVGQSSRSVGRILDLQGVVGRIPGWRELRTRFGCSWLVGCIGTPADSGNLTFINERNFFDFSKFLFSFYVTSIDVW